MRGLPLRHEAAQDDEDVRGGVQALRPKGPDARVLLGKEAATEHPGSTEAAHTLQVRQPHGPLRSGTLQSSSKEEA